MCRRHVHLPVYEAKLPGTALERFFDVTKCQSTRLIILRSFEPSQGFHVCGINSIQATIDKGCSKTGSNLYLPQPDPNGCNKQVF